MPINFKLINYYQWKYPSLLAKYKMGMYHKYYFCGGINIYLNLIPCEDKIFITLILQSYILHWYRMYLFFTVMDITEAVILQHFYCLVIIESVQKEVTNCDTSQCKKRSNI